MLSFVTFPINLQRIANLLSVFPLSEMSFLTTTKIIGKRLKPTDYNQYIAELVLLALIAIAYFGYDDLSPLRHAAAIATVERNDFALIGGLGLYAIRLSSFVAMFRQYRMPQTPEWLVFIGITAAMVVCFAYPARS